jgi:hypothetical protein
MTACNYCAEHGKGHGICCDSIYRHSHGRDDDDFFQTKNDGVDCTDMGGTCNVGQANCYPGLTCGAPTFGAETIGAAKTCQLKEDDPNAHAAAALVMSSSSTGAKGGPSFVLIVLGLLGAAVIALKVAQRRHRGLLRRHQYNEVDATPIKV